MSSPFVTAANDIHHSAVIELLFDVHNRVSVLSRSRSICQIALEVHVQLRDSVLANNPVLSSVTTASLLKILNETARTLCGTRQSPK